MSDRPYKRKQYLVDRAYQIRFVTRVFVVVLAVAIVSALMATGFLWSNMYAPELEQHALLVASLVAIATTLLIELLLAIPIVFYLGIRQSHRIIGPVSRIKRMLDAIGQGDFTQRITLRQGDALEDLAKSINQMADTLQRRYSK